MYKGNISYVGGLGPGVGEFKLDKYSVFYPNGNFFLNREAYFCAAKIKRKETDDARQY